MTAGPVLSRLRDATGPIHARLDGGVRAVERLATPDRRDALLAAYHRFYAAVETAIAFWIPEAPRRFAQESPPDPELSSRGEALGALYVVEGSTLGGRMILKALAARGARTDDLGFLDPYGPNTGERWRAFLPLLETAPPEEAERGALAAFGLAEALLVERQSA